MHLGIGRAKRTAGILADRKRTADPCTWSRTVAAGGCSGHAIAGGATYPAIGVTVQFWRRPLARRAHRRCPPAPAAASRARRAAQRTRASVRLLGVSERLIIDRPRQPSRDCRGLRAWTPQRRHDVPSGRRRPDGDGAGTTLEDHGPGRGVALERVRHRVSASPGSAGALHPPDDGPVRIRALWREPAGTAPGRAARDRPRGTPRGSPRPSSRGWWPAPGRRAGKIMDRRRATEVVAERCLAKAAVGQGQWWMVWP